MTHTAILMLRSIEPTADKLDAKIIKKEIRHLCLAYGIEFISCLVINGEFPKICKALNS